MAETDGRRRASAGAGVKAGMLTDSLFRLRSLFRRKEVESEMEDEIRFHCERQIEKYLKLGMSREEAARRARLDFGGLEQVREECRDARGVSPIETVGQDLRYAWRTLLKSPAFAATALFTLALGIGANSAIFSVVYGILLRPLPFPDTSRLVLLNETTPKVGAVSVSYPNFLDWRSQSHAFSSMAAVSSVEFNMSGVEQPEHIGGLAVSSSFLSIMGIRPVVGRGFAPDEETAGTSPVVLLSYPLWQSHFGGNRGVVGQTIHLDQRNFTIVGVLPPGFRWVDKCDVMEPIGVWVTDHRNAAERGERNDMLVAGRIAANVTIEQGRREMEVIAARLAAAYPEANELFGVRVQPLRDAFLGDVRPAIFALSVAAMLVLLIACANVANLFLMRGAVRAREMALRVAIGASRNRIVRQVLTEGFLVAVLGGLAGLSLAAAAIPVIARLIPPNVLAGATVEMNAAVPLFAAVLVILCVLAFGLVPALHFASGNAHSELKEGANTTAGRERNHWRGLLATTEIALALILLVGAGLTVKSLHRLLSVDSGFRADRVLKLAMSLRTVQYQKNYAVIGFWQQVLDQVRALPEVSSAAFGTAVPLTNDHSRTDITVEGVPLPKPGSFPHPDVHVVTPDYEKTLGIRMIRGRGFIKADGENALPVAMVNEKAAQTLFPGADPVGKRFAFGRLGAADGHKWLTIVGVLADTKLYGLANPARLEVYVPFRQRPDQEMTLLVKSSLEPSSLVPAIRSVVSVVDKEQPIHDVATMRQVMDASVSTPRITLILLSVFGGLALVLASIGIYGVISYSVAQQKREIGIRMALGADRGDVLRLILLQGGKIALAGIAVGTAVSFALSRLTAKLLYSVSALDPVTFSVVAVLLALIALFACYLPARRALKVDPLIALRQD